VLDAVNEAESNARGEDKPKGLLRIACPTALARSYVMPHVKSLLKLYPEMDLELQVSDRFIDLVEEGVDLAIRIGTLKDSTLKARRIGTAERICVASPEYLALHPAPKSPEQLQQHDCIVYTLLSAGSTWSFKQSDVEVNGRFRVNTPDGVYRAAVDGLGVAYAPVWLFQEALLEGKLRLLLVKQLGPPTPINIVYSARRLLPRRASVFMNFIAEEFSRIPALTDGAVARLLRNKRR
jgi:DNA-binding transcriptional LysR family regulator